MANIAYLLMAQLPDLTLNIFAQVDKEPSAHINHV
jgi:hypothetical protein